MSFILEAIRRSEEARHKRLIPDVSTIHTVSPVRAKAGSRTVQAALAMGLALASIVAGGVSLGPWLRQLWEADPPAPLAAAAPAATAAAERDVPAGSEPAPPPAEPVLAAPPQHTADTAPAATAAAKPEVALSAGEEPVEAKRPRRPYSAPAFGEAAKPRHEPRALAAAPPASSETGSGEAGTELMATQPKAGELVAATALRDLPPSVQRTLPSIAITLHRYAASTDARMIRVNGRVAREGDLIAADLSVAEITRSGVVFAIGGQRFYMDAFQTWQVKTGP